MLRPSERYVKELIDLPFCLFLMLTIFLSLDAPREANGRRAGEGMVVTVVMLSRYLEDRVLLIMSRFSVRNVRGNC